jgi:hypothetical protein
LDPYICSRDQRTIQGIETQWFPAAKKFKTQKASSKVLASVFWDKNGILLVDYLEKGANITVKYYVALLDKLKHLRYA